MSIKKVPALNLNDYLSSDESVKQKFVKDLYNSFKEYGFVVLQNHTISKELMDKAYALQKQLFDLPLETKQKFIMNNGGQRGYTPFGTENAKGFNVKDMKEFYHVGREFKETDLEYEFYPKNVWPLEIPEFKDTFMQIYGELEKAGDILLEALTESLDVPKDFLKNDL